MVLCGGLLLSASNCLHGHDGGNGINRPMPKGVVVFWIAPITRRQPYDVGQLGVTQLPGATGSVNEQGHNAGHVRGRRRGAKKRAENR